MFKSKYFIAFILLMTAGLSAQSVKTRVWADSLHYQIGDPAGINVVVELPKGAKIKSPEIGKYINGGEILEKNSVRGEKSGNITKSVFRFAISRYDSGDVVISPVEIFYTLKGDTTEYRTLTNEIRVLFSTLSVDTQKDIKDIKAPMRIPLDWKLVLLYVLAGLIVLALLIYVFIRWKKRTELRSTGEVPQRIIPPYEFAINSLKELEIRQLWQKGMIKEYYTEAADIIRRYIEDQYQIKALEVTTDELLEMLKCKGFNIKLIRRAEEFFTAADLVKFAKHKPSEIQNAEFLRLAYEILESTAPADDLATVGHTGIKRTGGEG